MSLVLLVLSVARPMNELPMFNVVFRAPSMVMLPTVTLPRRLAIRLTLLYADVCVVPSANRILPLGPKRIFEILPVAVIPLTTRLPVPLVPMVKLPPESITVLPGNVVEPFWLNVHC